MNCPYCGALIGEHSKYCIQCGAELSGAGRGGESTRSVGGGQVAKAAGSTGILLGKAARQARLEAVYEPDQLIGERAYNGILLGVLVWGLLVNVLLCLFIDDVTYYIPPVPFLIGYAVCAIAGIMIACKSNKPLVSFLGYNLVVIPFGLALTTVVAEYGGIRSSLVGYAFLYTLLITVGMTGAALAFPQLFQKLGGALLGVLIGLIVCEVVLLLLGVDQQVSDWLAAGLFSLYIGYDVYRSQQFAKTVDNAVDCALDIYLDIANLFIRLLQIMGKRKD